MGWGRAGRFCLEVGRGGSSGHLRGVHLAPLQPLHSAAPASLCPTTSGLETAPCAGSLDLALAAHLCCFPLLPAVTRGEVEGTVEFTGKNTFFGKTAQMLQGNDGLGNLQKILLRVRATDRWQGGAGTHETLRKTSLFSSKSPPFLHGMAVACRVWAASVPARGPCLRSVCASLCPGAALSVCLCPPRRSCSCWWCCP